MAWEVGEATGEGQEQASMVKQRRDDDCTVSMALLYYSGRWIGLGSRVTYLNTIKWVGT